MRHIVCLLAVLCLAVPVVAAPGAAELVQQQKSLTLGEGKTVSAFTVSVGHMNVVLDSGTVAPVLAGGQQVGLFLSGSGTFTYQTVNKDELTALRYNAKHADLAVQPTATEATIKEKFKSVLLRGNGLPEVTGAAAPAPGTAFNDHRELFARQTFADPDEYLFVLHALNAPASRVVRADVNGVDRPYVYLYDDVWTRNESLVLLRRPQYRVNKDASWLYTTPLSSQAIGRENRAAAPPAVKLTDLDVNLVNTDGPNATLTVVETLVPVGRAIGAIQFDQYSEYYFDINREPRRYNVRSVTDDQGNKLSFHHEMGTLLVSLAQPTQPGRPIKLKFEIDGNILYRPDGSNYWELGIEPWFPMLRTNEMMFTYHALLKVKKPFEVFTSGKTIRRESEGDWNVLESRLDVPAGYIAILAGKYQYDEETKNGLTVRVASFIVKNAEAYKSLRSIAFAAAEIYPRFLGPFPFDEITIIERNDFGWGQAPAGLVFITKEAFTPKQAEANEYVVGVNRRIAHELAHMYWGGALKAESSEDVWIQEAFAEYSAALFMKDAGRPGDYTKALAHWKADSRDSAKVSIIPMGNRLFNEGDPLDSFITRSNLVYSKGALLLAALHRELGDETFLTFLKSYQKSFKGKYGNTAHALGLLQFMTKKDYAPFFEQYYYGTAIPEVKK
ncbi:MAG TPA: M1 family aminopeptidase [Thermoanaerobaculia bacterium]